MVLRVTFELEPDDLAHFAEILKRARSAEEKLTREQILSAANGLLEEIKNTKVPTFMRQRIEQLELLVAMIEDREWQLPEEDAHRVLQALAYFSDPEDLIPDDVPGLGFLDDAIMVELVVRGLRPEIEAYQDFCEFREKHRREQPDVPEAASREAWLEKRRAELQERMHRQRRRERAKGPMKFLMGLFGR